MSEADFEVVWPLGKQVDDGDAVSADTGAAPDLDHATIGFVWNYTRKGDQMFGVMKELLRAEHPGIRFVDYDTFGDIHGAHEPQVIAALPGQLRAHKVDFSIVGISG